MTKPLNPRQVALTFLCDKRLPPDSKVESWDPGYEKNSVSGCSVASIDESGELQILQKASLDCFDRTSAEIDGDTLFNIASMTKIMTAATLLRMMETMNETDRARYFPQGLDTKLSDFYNFIEQRYPEPHRNYVRNTMRSENPEISLRNLLNHTSGIPDINWNLADPNDMRELYSEEKVADGKFLELDYAINPRRLPNERRVAVGTYFYSDPGYELLGMIISAVATHQNGRVVPCQEVMREMVIRRLELGNTFTSDQISFDRDLGRVVVTGSPEKKIARGYVYYNNDLIESRGFGRCVSCAAVYSSPAEICKFIKAVFSDKTYEEGGLFDDPKTIKLHNSSEVAQIRRSDGVHFTDEMGKHYYGIGFKFSVLDDGRKIKYHTGDTVGFPGWASYHDGEVVCCLTNSQCLTTPFAKAIYDLKNEQRIARGEVAYSVEEKHSQLCEINEYLVRNHSKERLLEDLRAVNAAENSAEEMRRRIDDLYPDLAIEEQAAKKVMAHSLSVEIEG